MTDMNMLRLCGNGTLMALREEHGEREGSKQTSHLRGKREEQHEIEREENHNCNRQQLLAPHQHEGVP